jgi:hypothetical protein
VAWNDFREESSIIIIIIIIIIICIIIVIIVYYVYSFLMVLWALSYERGSGCVRVLYVACVVVGCGLVSQICLF